MKAIVAVDQNWGIGYKGKLLERIPEDMKFFKDMTIGKVVVMGRETFESLPGQKPLKDRINIVLSRSMKKDSAEDVIVCNSMEELSKEILQYPEDDICIIGGASVYKQMLDCCSEVYVTKFANTHDADCYYPDSDNHVEWTSYQIGGDMEWNGISYTRYRYEK